MASSRLSNATLTGGDNAPPVRPTNCPTTDRGCRHLQEQCGSPVGDRVPLPGLAARAGAATHRQEGGGLLLPGMPGPGAPASIRSGRLRNPTKARSTNQGRRTGSTPASDAAGPTPSPEPTVLSSNRQAGLGAPATSNDEGGSRPWLDHRARNRPASFRNDQRHLWQARLGRIRHLTTQCPTSPLSARSQN